MIVLTIIIFQGLIFVGLIFLLRHFMQNHVTGAVGHLQKLNDELQKQQAELKQKIADADKEYQTKLAKARQEATSVQTQAKQEASKVLEEAKTRALAEREKIINEAVSTRDKMRQEVMAEMETHAIQHSKILIGEFFSGDFRKLVHDYLVKEVIDGLRDVSMEQFQINTDVADLVTAESLSEETKNKIAKALKEKIKRDVKFKEEIDASLVGGLVLRFGTFVIDGSLTNRLTHSAEQLKKETARRYQGTT